MIIESLIKTMVGLIDTLQKENAQLKQGDKAALNTILKEKQLASVRYHTVLEKFQNEPELLKEATAEQKKTIQEKFTAYQALYQENRRLLQNVLTVNQFFVQKTFEALSLKDPSIKIYTDSGEVKSQNKVRDPALSVDQQL